MRALAVLNPLALLAFGLLAACGSTDPTSESEAGGRTPRDTAERLLPWKTGNAWTYRVTDSNGEVTTKVQTVGEEEVVGGSGPNQSRRAFKAVTEKGEGDRTVSWQADLGDKIVRYREQSFSASTGDLELEEHWEPYKLRVDESEERTRAGVSWLEDYDETKLPVGLQPISAEARDSWTVIAENEAVTVPAGTFEAIVLEKVGGSTKRYWFVPGVGKVKETGGQMEELVSYEVEL